MCRRSRKSAPLGSALFWIGFAVLLVGSLWLRLQRLESYPWDYDEGIFLMFGRLIEAGYQPYSEAVISYLPPFPLAIALLWHLFGSVNAIRVALTLLALAGVASTGLLARHLAGNLAGLICMALISFQPDFVQASRAVMADVPALSLATIAIACAWGYAETGRPWWLVGAMLALGLSLTVKFLVAFAVPLCLVLFLWRQLGTVTRSNYEPRAAASGTGRAIGQPIAPAITPEDRACRLRRTLVDCALALASFAAPLAASVLVFEPQAVLTQAVGFNVLGQVTLVKGTVQGNLLVDLAQKAQRLGSILGSEWGLVALALCGLAAICLVHARRLWPILAWLLLAGLSLLFDARLSQAHAVILLPPLALAAAIGLSCLWRSLRGRAAPQLVGATGRPALQSLDGQITTVTSPPPPVLAVGWPLRRQLVWQVACALAIVIWLSQLPAQVAALNPPVLPPIEGRQDVIEFIRQATFKGDCVITDEPAIALQADRLTPPELAEASEDRILTGHLTEQEIIAVTETRDCPAVVFSKKRRFAELLPGYGRWVQDHYLLRRDFGHDDVFTIKRGVHVSRAEPLAEIGTQVRLWDARLDLGQWKAGEQAPVRLYWEARQMAAMEDCKVFLHVRNQQGDTVAQADHVPFAGQLSVWPVGDILAESFRMDLPATLPEGEYTVAIGMYRPDTGERLTVTPDSSGENAVILGPVKVEAASVL